MIHCVLFRFRGSADEQAIDSALAELEPMSAEVDGVTFVRTARNMAFPRPAAHGYTHCVVSTIRDQEAMSAWMSYPSHVDWGRRHFSSDDALIDGLLALDLDDASFESPT